MASTPLDLETKETIKKMGNVKYIVAPDAVHHLYIAEVSIICEVGKHFEVFEAVSRCGEKSFG